MQASERSVWQSELSGLPAPRRGKVRDVYDLGDRLLLVASDRISAYDHVLRPAIPGKGLRQRRRAKRERGHELGETDDP